MKTSASLFLALVVGLIPGRVGGDEIQTQANVPAEITFTAAQTYADPFSMVTLDVLFTNPAGQVLRVPAFWAGGSAWKARYASPQPGVHRWTSECNVVQDRGLHGGRGQVVIAPYTGENPLYRHGPLRVAADHRHLAHADGTPFFWLGDTWWMGLCQRLHWPDEFQQLAADRRAKGFNVIQIVAGLYPDMFPFDPRGANEAGCPWETNYTRIRPEYFDAADQRLRYLVELEFTPCVVGAWGYFLPWMGVEKAKQHWRYLVARYGAWPVVWCVAGEANLPWYLAKGFPYDDRTLVKGWTEVMRSVRATDPFHRLMTIHPTGMGPLNARHAVDDVALLDFDMLQTPHGQREAVRPTLTAATNSYGSTPVMPMLNGEASYEMLSDKIPAQWPRAMFWVCMMNGAAGHTYGANGIWQCNRRGQPHGASPHGGSYGVIPWDDAMRLPGSQQIGFGKAFLAALPWEQCRPQPGTAEWDDTPGATVWGDWIWFPEGDPMRDAPVQARFFRRSFELPAAAQIERAVLRVAVDDRFTVWLNGQEVGGGANWGAPERFEVASRLRPGRNLLAVRAENLPARVTANPAGCLASLEIRLQGGGRLSIVSDATWRASKTEAASWREPVFDDAAWPAALATAHYGEGPWGQLGQEDRSVPPCALGLADELRVIYALLPRPLQVRGLPPGASYAVTLLDPVTGEKTKGAAAVIAADGTWRCPPPGHGHDWVVLLRHKR